MTKISHDAPNSADFNTAVQFIATAAKNGDWGLLNALSENMAKHDYMSQEQQDCCDNLITELFAHNDELFGMYNGAINPITGEELK